ncbi:MAG: sugar phosphate nucleotidyltransferase [Nitrospirales bacterium]
MKRRMPLSSLWSVILAGGDGERTRPFIQQWLGYPLPKQYCTFVGTRSMLQHTWDRANQLSNPNRKITVVASNHQVDGAGNFGGQNEGTLLFQPRNCDTGPGILLPLTYIRARDPQAVVAIFPADHFIFPEERFVETVSRAVRAIEFLTDRVILMGVRPTYAEPEYGWVVPGATLGWSGGSPIRAIRTFQEKPDFRQSQELLRQGALWNTFVMVGKVETLWNMGWTCFPEIMKGFDRLGKAVGTPAEGSTLQAIYQEMPCRNFSSEVLECLTDRLGIMELEQVMWSDWGRPERIVETLKAVGKQPIFSSAHNNPVSHLSQNNTNVGVV